MKNIKEIVEKINIPDEYIEYYGKNKAKIDINYYEKIKGNQNAKLILVTSINPTPYGEGKTTQSIGISMALNRLNKDTMLVLREPSLGPVFGIKGGAIGGGKCIIEPQNSINLHFTGDFHAITSANNLLCSVIDNHIFQGNKLNIDKNRIVIKRVVDMNDRALRYITVNMEGKKESQDVRNTGFEITAACELMAICALCVTKEDLKNKINNMTVAYTFDNKPVLVKELNVTNAMLALLEDVLKPNLVRTIEDTPCIVHLGPFANIAHGCNSLIATKMALKMSKYVVTEAGFGADLGAEKFFDIKCRKGNLAPDVAVIVVTTKALKYNGNVEDSEISKENVEAIKLGIKNLDKHIENIQKFGVPFVVCVNRFLNDYDSEIEFITNYLQNKGVTVSISTAYKDGSLGALDTAEKIIDKLNNEKSNFKFLYEDNLKIQEKIEKICHDIYGASSVSYSYDAILKINKAQDSGFGNLPICIAKTPSSLSDNPKIVGRPENFCITIKDIKINSGAGFIVAYAGNIMTMPGLGKKSKYEEF